MYGAPRMLLLVEFGVKLLEWYARTSKLSNSDCIAEIAVSHCHKDLILTLVSSVALRYSSLTI